MLFFYLPQLPWHEWQYPMLVHELEILVDLGEW